MELVDFFVAGVGAGIKGEAGDGAQEPARLNALAGGGHGHRVANEFKHRV